MRGAAGWLILSLVWTMSSEPNSFAGPPTFQSTDRASGSGTDSTSVFKRTSAEDQFEFETEQMEGSVRLSGPYHGVSRLVDKRTGIQVIDTRYSALNLFKLMSVNQCMGQPRSMERTTTVGDRWLEIHWSSTSSHLADVTARYELAAANAIDLTVTVRANSSYRAYELFLSNYFDKRLRPHVYLWSRNRRQGDLVLPMVNDTFRGTVLVFPRDSHAARHCLDGRWDRRENSTPVVQMCPLRHYVHCLGFLVDEDSRLAVLLMSRPTDCYAISTRYFAEDDADRLTTYSAFDLSLFGNDLVPGANRAVKVRLALTELDSAWSQPVSSYKSFVE